MPSRKRAICELPLQNGNTITATIVGADIIRPQFTNIIKELYGN